MSLLDKGFGLTASGFLRPSLADIIADKQQALDAATGMIWRKDPNAVIGGQIVGVMAKSEDVLWGQLQNVHSSFDPRTAIGAALEGLCALSLVYPRRARTSTGIAICTGDNGAQLLTGDVVESQDNQLLYEIANNTTLATAAAWVATTAYVVGDIRSHAGSVYCCTVAGTSGSVGPVATVLGGTETDGGVTWLFCGAGLAYFPAPISSVATGAIGGPSGSLTKIGTPRAGWRGVVNPDDVSIGSAQESDEQLRIRRVVSLAAFGRATIDAIRAGLLSLADVSGAFVFENTTLVTDGDGVPGKSVEPVITGPTGAPIDAEWAAQILAYIAAGIGTSSGTTQTTVADSYGITHSVGLTRPATTAIYAVVTVRADKTQWPSDATGTGGQALAQAAVLGYGQAFVAGLDARHSAIEGAVWRAQIPGVLGVSAQLDTVPITTQPPADVSIDLRHIAQLDTSRLLIVPTFEDP